MDGVVALSNKDVKNVITNKHEMERRKRLHFCSLSEKN